MFVELPLRDPMSCGDGSKPEGRLRTLADEIRARIQSGLRRLRLGGAPGIAGRLLVDYHACVVIGEIENPEAPR